MTVKKSAKKDLPPPIKPWHEVIWVRIVGFITILGAILTVLDTGTSLMEKFYNPIPKEFSVNVLPIRIHYQKGANASIKERVPYNFKISTYQVDYIIDSIEIVNFEIQNRDIINTDSITQKSIQFYTHGYMAEGDGLQTLHEFECHFNVYFSVLPSISDVELGKVLDIGYVILKVPYWVNNTRKFKEQRIPIELEIK